MKFAVNKDKCIGCMQCVSVCVGKHIQPGEDGCPAATEKPCSWCFHCQAICPERAIVFDGLDEKAQYPEEGDSPVERIVAARRSIRRYKQDAPTREEIAGALEAARFAPSARNLREHKFIVVLGKENTDKLLGLIIEYLERTGEEPGLLHRLTHGGHNPVTCYAPCLVMCKGEAGKRFADTDSVIAMTTLELILAERGIGTCWAGFLQRFCNDVPEIRAYLGLEDNESVYAALMVGYPDEEYQTPAWRKAVDTKWI